MPDNELEVSCPGCSAVFNVPAELAGEIAECSECGAVFEIPRPEEIEQLAGTETGAIKGKVTEESEIATNTVKLSRTSIGMIPSLKDSFTFGDPVRPSPPLQQQPPRPTSGPSFSRPPIPSQQPPPPPPPQRPSFAQQPQQAPQIQQYQQRPTISPPSSSQYSQTPAQAPQRPSFPIPSATPSIQQPPAQQSLPSAEPPQFKTQLSGQSIPLPPPSVTVPPQVSTPPPRPPSATSGGGAPKITFTKPSALPQQAPPPPPPPPPQTPSAVAPASWPQAQAQTVPPRQSVQLPSWVKFQIRPDEQVYGFREIEKNPVGIAIGASAPILICLFAVFLANATAIISYIIVFAVWFLAFITIATIVAKAKTLVALTSTRVIIIVGSKQLEINNK